MTMETKTIYYDGLEIRLECDIEEGNKGDGYITPIESDYLYISSVIVVHDNGDESDITGIVSSRTMDEWQLELNQ
jgi:hypothetical protein